MQGESGGAQLHHLAQVRQRGTELSNCLLRAQQAAYAGCPSCARPVRVVYLEGATVYLCLTQPGRLDEALLVRLRHGLRRELGFSPHLELCAV